MRPQDTTHVLVAFPNRITTTLTAPTGHVFNDVEIVGNPSPVAPCAAEPVTLVATPTPRSN